eukprot:scaffold45702_cov64-Phaeocystis_antarctica.AAC.2
MLVCREQPQAAKGSRAVLCMPRGLRIDTGGPLHRLRVEAPGRRGVAVAIAERLRRAARILVLLGPILLRVLRLQRRLKLLRVPRLEYRVVGQPLRRALGLGLGGLLLGAGGRLVAHVRRRLLALVAQAARVVRRARI